MLPQTKTLEELQGMSDDHLHRYFCQHARYFKEMPPKADYAIRLGCQSFYSDDTKDLWEQFKDAVRSNNGDRQSEHDTEV